MSPVVMPFACSDRTASWKQASRRAGLGTHGRTERARLVPRNGDVDSQTLARTVSQPGRYAGAGPGPLPLLMAPVLAERAV